MTDKNKGLYNKFAVNRTDGSSAVGGKHHACEYFVLDLTHDPFAIPALRAYAVACRDDYPALARDLEAKLPSTPSPDKVPTKLDSRTYHYCDDCGEMVSGRHECADRVPGIASASDIIELVSIYENDYHGGAQTDRTRRLRALAQHIQGMTQPNTVAITLPAYLARRIHEALKTGLADFEARRGGQHVGRDTAEVRIDVGYAKALDGLLEDARSTTQPPRE